MAKKPEAVAQSAAGAASETVGAKRKWHFPEAGIVVEADTLEEAQSKLAELTADRK